MTKTTDTAIPAPQPDDAGCDPIEDRLRETVRATIEALFDEEFAAYLGRIRYGRGGGARKAMHDELTEDYRDMIYAETAAEVETRRKAFLRKWRLKCRAVADSLEEAGERLFSPSRASTRRNGDRHGRPTRSSG
jgi:hypothetical protein